MIRGAVEMPGVVRGHQRAAVHYKRACLDLSLHRAAWDQLEEGTLKAICTYSFCEFFCSVSFKTMENRVLTLFCTLISTLGLVLSTQGQRLHTGLERNSPLRNLTFYHSSRYPLYMMQLYRSFRNADSSVSVSVSDVTMQRNNPPYRANSVLSLTAKGGWNFFS